MAIIIYILINAFKCENQLFFNAIYKFQGSSYLGYGGYNNINPVLNSESCKVARLVENFSME
ncbi:hypothetical protein MM213_02995 [Belliella sp. R4-6]|uniref:Uncharacterized protein n=1 Tax=Belliella alkalica TaxID=1730871 RepID=A0ABS9V7N9_9BACT|nr:hypothetical protein [Belliella alkalica]